MGGAASDSGGEGWPRGLMDWFLSDLREVAGYISHHIWSFRFHTEGCAGEDVLRQ